MFFINLGTYCYSNKTFTQNGYPFNCLWLDLYYHIIILWLYSEPRDQYHFIQSYKIRFESILVIKYWKKKHRLIIFSIIYLHKKDLQMERYLATSLQANNRKHVAINQKTHLKLWLQRLGSLVVQVWKIVLGSYW